MRKLTLLGILLAAGGFLGGLGSFAALAWSGDRIYEMELPRTGDGQPQQHEVTLELRPEMNPLAMTATSSDAGASATITVFDAAGESIFEQKQTGDPGGNAMWFFAPVEIETPGPHRVVYRVDRDIEGQIDLRANVFVLTPALMFACLGAMFVGFCLIIVASVQHAMRTMRDLRRMQGGRPPGATAAG